MEDYNREHHTGYSADINAQWTEKTAGGTVTRTEDVLNKEYEFTSTNDWLVSFEHLPKKTQDPNGEGMDIVYSVEEVSTKAGYTATVGELAEKDKVYLDLYKFWPDSNSNHRGAAAESFTVQIRDSEGRLIRAEQDGNGEWKYLGWAGEDAADHTEITFGSNAENEMFDYAARISGLPRLDADGAELAYTFEQLGDQDAKTTGLVMFTRPADEIRILNTAESSENRIRKLDEGGSGLADAVFQLLVVEDSERLVYDEKFNGKYEGITVDEKALETITIHTGNGSEGTDCSSAFRTTGHEQTVSGLPNGTYILREVEAPAGYVIELRDTQFTVHNGQISDVTESEKVNQTVSGTFTLLEITNTPAPLFLPPAAPAPAFSPCLA